MTQAEAEILNETRPVLILDDVRLRRKKVETLAGVSGVFRQGDLSIVHGGSEVARDLLGRVMVGQIPHDSGQIWREGPGPPVLGLAMGFNVGGPVLRGLELRAAAYGVRFYDYVDQVAAYMRNPDVLRKPLVSLTPTDRVTMLFASTYILPCSFFVAQTPPLPTDPKAREALTPLYEEVRQRAAIICLCKNRDFASSFEGRKTTRFKQGQLLINPPRKRKEIEGPKRPELIEDAT